MIRLYIFVLIAITAFTGAATKEQNKTKGNGVDYDELHNELANSLVRKTMFKAVQQVSRAISRTNHRWRTENIWSDPHQLLQFFKQPPNKDAETMSRAGEIFDVTINMVRDQLPHHRRFKRRVNTTDILSQEVIRDLMEFSGCRVNPGPFTCPRTCLDNMYRTYDGQCNNLNNPHWGTTNSPLVRWLPAQYENTFNSPRGWEEGRLYNGFPLPLVRRVSNDVVAVLNEDVTNDPDYSHLMVVWGQYIDHDMSFTPQSLSTSTFQGLTNCRETCENEPPCFPMVVPDDDPRVTTRRCIPFFRSSAVCGSGDTSSLTGRIIPREQLSTINSFVDGSALYGNSESSNLELRNLTTEDGLMKANSRFYDNGREFLPFNPANPCVQDRFDTSGEQIPCFKAGDPRASEHQTLASIHTLWLREHNRIAKRLKVINPHWSGETLYHEARKIVSALHQIVNWNEYLPKILGPTGMQRMGNFSGYDPSVNPTTSNVFATAAFRFGHVTIHPEFRRLNETFDDHPQFPTILLHEAFFSSWRVIRQGGLDPIMRGLIGRPAKLARPDELMNEELREKLFALQNQVALDLASLNIQRGRDHGLPGYNDWRVWCGMPFADNFTALAGEISNSEVRNRLERLYGHPSNVDVWVAGLVEDLIEGSRVGPLFECMLVRQFRNLRDGDRFFYRNQGQFNNEQLETLEGYSMARIICENTGLDRVQRDVFRLASFPRDFVQCQDIPTINLELWRESAEIGSCGVPPTIEGGAWRRCGSDPMSVTYYCRRGTTIMGRAELRCEDGSFNGEAPTCIDNNECETNNGGCEGSCQNTFGGFNCECPDENMEIDPDDDKKCRVVSTTTRPSAVVVENDDNLNVAAVVVGVLLAITVIGTTIVITMVVMKYIKLRKMNANSISKISFDDSNSSKSEFENPSFKSDQ